MPCPTMVGAPGSGGAGPVADGPAASGCRTAAGSPGRRQQRTGARSRSWSRLRALALGPRPGAVGEDVAAAEGLVPLRRRHAEAPCGRSHRVTRSGSPARLAPDLGSPDQHHQPGRTHHSELLNRQTQARHGWPAPAQRFHTSDGGYGLPKQPQPGFRTGSQIRRPRLSRQPAATSRRRPLGPGEVGVGDVERSRTRLRMISALSLKGSFADLGLAWYDCPVSHFRRW